MTSKSCRRFGVSDALILVASIAIGLAWTRHYLGTEEGWESYPYPESVDFLGYLIVPLWMRPAIWWVRASYHLVAVVTLGMLVLRWRRPRPSIHRLSRQPGVVACAAALLAMGAELVAKIPSASESIKATTGFRWDLDCIIYSEYWDMTGPSESLAVAVAWLMLGWSGRWRREPGWIDGAGIGLGIFWLAVEPLIWLVQGTLHVWYTEAAVLPIP